MVKSLAQIHKFASVEANRLYLRNPLRRAPIDRAMLQALERQGTNSDRAIIVATPGFDRADGGLFSLASIAAESAMLTEIHEAQVYTCPVPDEPPVARYTKFDNAMQPVPFWALVKRLTARNAEILIHMPECYASRAQRIWGLNRLKAMNARLRINVLLQNIDLAPTRDSMEVLKEFAPVTITTAHKAYCTPEISELLGAPIYHLSTFMCPELFTQSPWADKRNIVMLSPDANPERASTLSALYKALPEYQFVTVRNMHYRDYRALCSIAKFSITFGEGLDGYYIETIFSGGFSATVFNGRFFTEKYRNQPLMYPDWRTLADQFPVDIRAMDNAEERQAAWAQQFVAPASDYVKAEYLENLRKFYREAFPISICAA
jgi:hypothetical protein